jgi:hypothetical protein
MIKTGCASEVCLPDREAKCQESLIKYLCSFHPPLQNDNISTQYAFIHKFVGALDNYLPLTCPGSVLNEQQKNT